MRGGIGVGTGEFGRPSDADNAHFNYERHFRRNLEREERIKKRMDELRAERVEFERQRERDSQTARYGLGFTAGLFMCLVIFARSMYPS